MVRTLFIVICFFLMDSLQAQAKIDLQWAICDSNPEKVLALLNQDHSTPNKVGQITYFENFPKTFAANGISFRLKTKKGQLESSIKIRYPTEVVTSEDIDCTWDRYGEKKTFTCELKYVVTEHAQSPWSPEQKQFLENVKQIQWPQLVELGPYSNPKWTFEIEKYEVHFDYVDTGVSALMEISVKVKDSQEKEAYTVISSHLKKIGIKLCTVQEGKTGRLLRLIESANGYKTQ